MSINIEVDGVQYTNFESASCQLRLDALSSAFQFSAVNPDGQALPFKGGEACSIYVDGEKVLTGHIERLRASYSADEHRVMISGRDKTADLLDSTIDTINDLRGDELTLKFIIEKIIEHLGLDISVIDEVEPDPFSQVEDITAAEPGDGAFEVIERYARKRQVLLTSNADGNIVIASNSGTVAEGSVQMIFGAEDNNVLTSNFEYDTTGRFNKYRSSSGLNPVALVSAGDSDLASLVNQGGGVSDDEIRAGRQMIFVSESPFSSNDCGKRATWEANVRKYRGLSYSATVHGYRVGSDSGDLWQLNRLYQIVDESIGKVEQMLCNSITFSLSIDDGSMTSLGFVGKDAYTAFIEPDLFAQVAANVTPN